MVAPPRRTLSKNSHSCLVFERHRAAQPSTYLSCESGQHIQLAVLFRHALIGHVTRRPSSAHEHFARRSLERDVFHVGTDPTVGLAIHRLGTQGRRHQVDGTAFRKAAIKTQHSPQDLCIMKTKKIKAISLLIKRKIQDMIHALNQPVAGQSE